MAPLRPLLMLALLAWVAVADQESCKGRCTEGFNADKKCQCDELCSYYQSCCTDYTAECKPQVTRGDVFTMPEDEYVIYDDGEEKNNATIHEQPEGSSPSPDLQAQPEGHPEQATVLNPEEESPAPEVGISKPEGTDSRPETLRPGTPELPAEEELCSGKPFDAFTDLKNGSLFAFRGESRAGIGDGGLPQERPHSHTTSSTVGQYCYELDEKAVRPGYPKLIRDVWGIEGPIDAAFTRINCQGKTYLFKGSQYWRFEDGVLDPDYPRNISDGFDGIPDNVDAALALPAHSYSGRERVYFFKGKQYWEYQFQHQPSQEECEGSSRSAVFEHFAVMQRDSWEDIFELLFWGRTSAGMRQPQFISRDWHGVPGQVDAAMAGRIYVSGMAPHPSLAKKQKFRRRNRKGYRSDRGHSRGRNQNSRRPSRAMWRLSLFSSEESNLGADNYDDYRMDWLVPATCEPIQSVFFFSGDKYYRVNLRTRRVDAVDPPYPRSIAQYWLGCPAPGHL